MNLNIKRTIFAILTIATCIIIFIFSNQNGEKSGLTSRGFVRKIVEITGITNNLNEEKTEKIIENCQFAVRKLAHFSIYTILGINTLGFMNTYKKISLRKQIGITLLFGCLYATSDEFHQMFSNGRTASPKDVGIDTLGVLFGIGIYLLVKKIITIIKEHKLETRKQTI